MQLCVWLQPHCDLVVGCFFFFFLLLECGKGREISLWKTARANRSLAHYPSGRLLNGDGAVSLASVVKLAAAVHFVCCLA